MYILSTSFHWLCDNILHDADVADEKCEDLQHRLATSDVVGIVFSFIVNIC